MHQQDVIFIHYGCIHPSAVSLLSLSGVWSDSCMFPGHVQPLAVCVVLCTIGKIIGFPGLCAGCIVCFSQSEDGVLSASLFIYLSQCFLTYSSAHPLSELYAETPNCSSIVCRTELQFWCCHSSAVSSTGC